MTDLKRKIWALIRGGNFKGYPRTVSGYPLTLNDCMENGLTTLTVYGNSDNTSGVTGVGDITGVSPYESYDYKIPVKFCGKNLLNIMGYTWELGSISGNTGANVSANDRCRATDYIPVYGGTYILSKNSGRNTAIRLYDSNKNFIRVNELEGFLFSDSSYKCVVFPDNTAYMRMVISNTVIDENQQIQLERSDTPTEYEEYCELILPIYLDAPLYTDDSIALNISKKYAELIRTNGSTTNISDKTDWNKIKSLWNGTVTVSADTEVKPSSIKAVYYAAKPEGGN